MYTIWLGSKPLLNKRGKIAKFKYGLALQIKERYKFAKMRPCTIGGRWGERILKYS